MGIAMTEVMLVLVFLMGGQTGVPLGLPPAPQDPVMSQFAPEECLVYTAWAGTVELDPQANPTERWMANPEIQGSFNKLKLAIRTLATSGRPNEAEFGELAYQLAEKCLSNACGFYVGNIEPVEFSVRFSGGALITLGDDAASFTDALSTSVIRILEQEGETVAKVTIDDRSFYQIRIQEGPVEHEITWGLLDNQYLAITAGENEMQNLMANMQSAAPRWLEDLTGEIQVDRTSAITWVNVPGFFEMVKQSFGPDREELDRVLEVTGLDGVGSVGWVAGLDDQGFLCRGSIKMEGEPRGVMDLFAGEPLEPEYFGKIAADRMVMTGMRISPPKVMSLIRDINDLNEWSRGDFDAGVAALNGMLGIDIEEDILNVLDDHAFIYGSVNFANPTAGWVLGIGASNEMELTDTYEKINEFIRTSTAGAPDVEFEESAVGDYIIYGVKDTSEWNMMPNFSWTLADGELLLSMDKSSLRRHLRREAMADDAMANDPWFNENGFSPPRMDAEGPLFVASVDFSSVMTMGVPLLSVFGFEMFPPGFEFSFDDIPPIADLTRDMKPNITSLYRTPEGFESVQRQTYPGGSPGTLMAIGVIGVMPATMEVRAAAHTVSSANQMRQMLLAMHNFHDARRGFPARYSINDDGEPLLSWRVYILPFLEQNALYEEFHLDEPWDSEHNKTLIERMPECYVHPRIEAEAGQTVYVVPMGEGTTMMDPTESGIPIGTRLETVMDGTSQTGVIFEVKPEHAVIWTKPDDLDWRNMEDPVEALFGIREGEGLNVAFADGSVQRISREKLSEFFEKLVLTDDGEYIDWHDDSGPRRVDRFEETEAMIDEIELERAGDGKKK